VVGHDAKQFASVLLIGYHELLFIEIESSHGQIDRNIVVLVALFFIRITVSTSTALVQQTI
jgi:hypothetical protein